MRASSPRPRARRRRLLALAGTGSCESCSAFGSLVETCDWQGALSCVGDGILYERGCFDECPVGTVRDGACTVPSSLSPSRPCPADSRLAAARRFCLSCLPRRRRQLQPRDGPALVRRRLLLELFFLDRSLTPSSSCSGLLLDETTSTCVTSCRYVADDENPASYYQGASSPRRPPTRAEPDLVSHILQAACASRAAASRSSRATGTAQGCAGCPTCSPGARPSARRSTSASPTRPSRFLGSRPVGGTAACSTGRARGAAKVPSVRRTSSAALSRLRLARPSSSSRSPSSPLSSPFSLCRSQGILSSAICTVRVQRCARISRHGRSERSRALRKAIGSRVAARTAIVPLRRSRAAEIRRSSSPRPLKMCSRAALVALMRIVSATRKLGASPGKRAPAVLAPQLFLSLALAGTSSQHLPLPTHTTSCEPTRKRCAAPSPCSPSRSRRSSPPDPQRRPPAPLDAT